MINAMETLGIKEYCTSVLVKSKRFRLTFIFVALIFKSKGMKWILLERIEMNWNLKGTEWIPIELDFFGIGFLWNEMDWKQWIGKNGLKFERNGETRILFIC